MADISSLSDPKLIATLTIDGDVLDARLVGTQVRVATVSSPDVDAPSPVYTPDGGISQKSKDELEAAVAKTTVDDWIPTYTVQDGGCGSKQGTSCGMRRSGSSRNVLRARHGGGVVVRYGFGLQSRKTVGVIAGGQQIYATDTSTYVSTTDWSRDGSAAKRTCTSSSPHLRAQVPTKDQVRFPEPC